MQINTTLKLYLIAVRIRVFWKTNAKEDPDKGNP